MIPSDADVLMLIEKPNCTDDRATTIQQNYLYRYESVKLNSGTWLSHIKIVSPGDKNYQIRSVFF